MSKSQVFKVRQSQKPKSVSLRKQLVKYWAKQIVNAAQLPPSNLGSSGLVWEMHYKSAYNTIYFKRGTYLGVLKKGSEK
jgi:hypothetical protein